MDYTPLSRIIFNRIAHRTQSWNKSSERIQRDVLRTLLIGGKNSEIGEKYGFADILASSDIFKSYKERVPLVDYEDIREDVKRMINGERDVLWPGRCRDYAQSSGTSGGRSKYIPITRRSLKRCHYKGSADCVAHYLKNNPKSRIFSGKGLILGGSFASELKPRDSRVNVGDLSATLINRISPAANFFRIPNKETALMEDWNEKLPALVKASKDANITNLSGVPSWFLTVLKEVMHAKGVSSITEVWPNLEVFFHGGISFDPYRDEYQRICNSSNMHFMETYNASEGFFAIQDDLSDSTLLLLIDNDVFYEFIPLGEDVSSIVPVWELKENKVYELVITSSNGLWRYRIGDTVRVTGTNPVKIKIAGRTRSFINAFGEELMEENAEKGISQVCHTLGVEIKNYTAAPVFAEGDSKGCHQWIIEWDGEGADEQEFGRMLDEALRKENSDYDAKRSGDIFLDGPQIKIVPAGTFDRWLHTVGNHKLGGQRKIPRLANDRHIADAILQLL